MGRNSFVFYKSWFDAIVNLPRDVQGDVLTAIIEYGLNGATTERLKPIAKAMLEMVKHQINTNNSRYENGCKGGRPSNQIETESKPNGNQTETKTKPNVYEYDYVNDNNIPPIIPPSGRGSFIKPCIEQISEYCSTRNNGIDASEFYDFYESKGWMIGKNKMKDWKAAIRTWERSKQKTPQEKQQYADE